MMTSQKLRESYRSEVTGSEVVDGRDCWVLEMSARDETVTYPKRKTWIVKDEKLALKQELYALSGMHLKDLDDVEKLKSFRVVADFQPRW